MDKINKGFLKTLSDMYKNLPLKMRVMVNKTATELLEIQKENNSFPDKVGDRSEGDERGNGE